MQTDLLQSVAYGLSTDKLTFHFCNLYSNAGSTHASVFFKPATESWRTAQGLNFFDRPLWGLFRVKPLLENLCMTLATVL